MRFGKLSRVRSVLLIMVLAALPVAVAACGESSSSGTSSSEGGGGTAKQAADPNETYVWVSQDSTLPLFVENDFVGLEKAAEQLGVKYEVQGPSNINLSQLIATINQVCAQKPAGVIVVGWDPSENEAVNQCIEEGVPTVTDDADLPESKRLAFVGTNWYDIGVAQAEAMIKATGGKGEVALLSIINANNTREADEGFKATLKEKAPGMTLVAEEDDGGERAKAAAKVADLLAAYPNLAGIAGFDAESGPGTVQALSEAGKLGSVKVTSMEAEPQFFKQVQEGNVSAVIVQKRELFTYYAMNLLYDYNHNELSVEGVSKEVASPIPVDVNTGLLTIEKSNVGEIIKATSK